MGGGGGGGVWAWPRAGDKARSESPAKAVRRIFGSVRVFKMISITCVLSYFGVET
jgi:hypothetical protein